MADDLAARAARHRPWQRTEADGSRWNVFLCVVCGQPWGEHGCDAHRFAQAWQAAEQQIERLADYIMREVPGEPSQSQGAIETAIRVLGELQQQGKPDPTADLSTAAIARRAPFAYGQWRVDLATLLERLAQAEQRAQAAEARVVELEAWRNAPCTFCGHLREEHVPVWYCRRNATDLVVALCDGGTTADNLCSCRGFDDKAALAGEEGR